MTDDELVAALGEIFAAETPPAGIDRSTGFGEDYRIESPRIVASDDGFDDLEVTVHFRRRLLSHRRNVVSRLLFDRAWREASDLVDPVSCAAYVVDRWHFSVVEPEASGGRHRAAAERSVPDAEASWQALLERLGALYDDVRERDGVIEVTDTDEGVCFVHVTPDQWRSFVVESEIDARHDHGEDAAASGDGPIEAIGLLGELIDSRWDDEHHVVFFRGDLRQSIRAELPPVRSMLLRDPALPPEGDWYAFAPDEDP